MDYTNDLEEIKQIVRGIMTTRCKVRTTYSDILREYREFEGRELPLAGFKTAVDLLRSMPDVLYIEKTGNLDLLHLVQSESSEHIQKLVMGQKHKSNRKSLPGQYFNNNQNGQRPNHQRHGIGQTGQQRNSYGGNQNGQQRNSYGGNQNGHQRNSYQNGQQRNNYSGNQKPYHQVNSNQNESSYNQSSFRQNEQRRNNYGGDQKPAQNGYTSDDYGSDTHRSYSQNGRQRNSYQKPSHQFNNNDQRGFRQKRNSGQQHCGANSSSEEGYGRSDEYNGQVSQIEDGMEKMKVTQGTLEGNDGRKKMNSKQRRKDSSSSSVSSSSSSIRPVTLDVMNDEVWLQELEKRNIFLNHRLLIESVEKPKYLGKKQYITDTVETDTPARFESVDNYFYNSEK